MTVIELIFSFYYHQVNHVIEIDDIVFLVREISWKEGLEIDARSFRKKEDLIYQNTEFEKREILKMKLKIQKGSLRT